MCRDLEPIAARPPGRYRGQCTGQIATTNNLLYQLLVGSWPVELLESLDASALEAYASRIKAAALRNAMREGQGALSFGRRPMQITRMAMQSFARAALDVENVEVPFQLPAVRAASDSRLGVETVWCR